MKETSPLLAIALTHVHVGAEGSRGVVDLPIIRDPFGIPFIPASSFKGSLKSSLARKFRCLDSGGRVKCEVKKSENQSNKKENVNTCNLICCLLGHEPEDTEKGASKLILGDLYPLFIPFPSLNDVFAYATSPYLLSRAKLNGIDLNIDPNSIKNKEKKKVFVELEKFEAVELDDEIEERMARVLGSKKEDISNLIPFLQHTKVYLFEDADIVNIIEKALFRVTRIRLNYRKKTVQRGGVWKEEYLPHGTVFTGLIGTRGFENEYCESSSDNNNKKVSEEEELMTLVKEEPIEVLKRLLSKDNKTRGPVEFDLALGGKETLGKGMLKFLLR
ncbi:hypothetical protein IPA_01620 [Ignicoccus pacificus DSM 13166]|uniref:CRISPR type III-associated protein domain-containing protein n=1 Tax=Ignicoccus pacificus DSM 13166 TaxID=940294 RepID=A0A977PL94_9CREN|nr:hypothetical protein IPA_01620 [Ignicoccus pacificus DSM 13166]